MGSWLSVLRWRCAGQNNKAKAQEIRRQLSMSAKDIRPWIYIHITMAGTLVELLQKKRKGSLPVPFQGQEVEGCDAENSCPYSHRGVVPLSILFNDFRRSFTSPRLHVSTSPPRPSPGSVCRAPSPVLGLLLHAPPRHVFFSHFSPSESHSVVGAGVAHRPSSETHNLSRHALGLRPLGALGTGHLILRNGPELDEAQRSVNVWSKYRVIVGCCSAHES